MSRRNRRRCGIFFCVGLVRDIIAPRRTYSGPTEFWAAILKLISPADGALDRQIKNYNFE
jgi:hypothetical protein